MNVGKEGEGGGEGGGVELGEGQCHSPWHVRVCASVWPGEEMIHRPRCLRDGFVGTGGVRVSRRACKGRGRGGDVAWLATLRLRSMRM